MGPGAASPSTSVVAAGRARCRPGPLLLGIAILAVLLVAACGDDAESGSSATSVAPETAPPTGETLFPDVVEVEVTPVGGGEFEVAATLSSPYDSPERYADAWRVVDAEGNELGVRELAHDHAGEQPFTRTLTVPIPDDVDEVTVEGRDQVSGYGGETVTVAVPRG